MILDFRLIVFLEKFIEYIFIKFLGSFVLEKLKKLEFFREIFYGFFIVIKFSKEFFNIFVVFEFIVKENFLGEDDDFVDLEEFFF